LKANLPTIERYDLLAFSNMCASKYEMLDREFVLAGRPLLTAETMGRLTDLVRSEGIEQVQWSGPTRVVASEEAS
jgi:hypothetical protein